ncbi:MAG TPA: MarR family transcriptional regulator [Polyangia bacterium]|nr:MarR family transcriptional regulator [Polyangia bacterium]
MADSRRRAQLIARLHARKQVSVGQLLFKAARRWNEHAMAEVQRRVPEARLAHTTLLPHIDLDGTRPTEIARRAGISKQAVGQLVDEMVRLGMLERIADPDDGRAQRVRFTDEGIAQLLAGLDVIDVIEVELGAALGASMLHRLQRDLTKLIPALQKLER